MAHCLLSHWASYRTGTRVIKRLYLKAARTIGWLGYPQITDGVQGLGNHTVAGDIYLTVAGDIYLHLIRSHAAVLLSIVNLRGSAE
jgi:hypothetical protein